jgi:hypothetical protein
MTKEMLRVRYVLGRTKAGQTRVLDTPSLYTSRTTAAPHKNKAAAWLPCGGAHHLSRQGWEPGGEPGDGARKV